MLCELGLCVQSYVQEMQTTPDTNKSVTLFQKAFQNKNIDDICSKLFMIKHISVSITTTKDQVPQSNCLRVLTVTNAHTKG